MFNSTQPHLSDILFKNETIAVKKHKILKAAVEDQETKSSD